jgi:hypothetical protein
MGAAGAGSVVGAATKVGKGAMKKFSGANWAKQQYTDYKKERDTRKEDARWKPGKKFGKGVNNALDTTMATIGSTKAQRRKDNRKQAERAKEIKEDAESLKGSSIEDITIKVNACFDNKTGELDKDKVNRTTAGNARAFMDKNADDRKSFVEDEILSGPDNKIKNMLAGAPPKIQQAMAVVNGSPLPSPPAPKEQNYNDSLRQVTSYVSGKAEQITDSYKK